MRNKSVCISKSSVSFQKLFGSVDLQKLSFLWLISCIHHGFAERFFTHSLLCLVEISVLLN